MSQVSVQAITDVEVRIAVQFKMSRLMARVVNSPPGLASGIEKRPVNGPRPRVEGDDPIRLVEPAAERSQQLFRLIAEQV